MFKKLVLCLLPFFKGTKADFATYGEMEKHLSSSIHTPKLEGGMQGAEQMWKKMTGTEAEPHRSLRGSLRRPLGVSFPEGELGSLRLSHLLEQGEFPFLPHPLVGRAPQLVG